ncbi:hypothetical protein RclHR1_06420015 [Rhizophagus clarus]|uniref:Uncharacterized protein n=1 Tax=Rhizophagus clarus TaxID=94130 RepID=A0A2Z6S9W9_9GLOM|nr:hypothetical protein RclHR1_06420015 [Rhizophagus clarus]
MVSLRLQPKLQLKLQLRLAILIVSNWFFQFQQKYLNLSNSSFVLLVRMWSLVYTTYQHFGSHYIIVDIIN